jgi:ABC-type glycerol-3-phosphate transport system substrate-binding protein
MYRFKKQTWLTAALLLTLTACGGGSSAPSTATAATSVDVLNAPAAKITFPTPFLATEGDSIIVRGTASHPNEITVVRVNGIDATSTDNFATWQAPLTLTPGFNDLTVETGDIALNANMAATSARINAYGVAFSSPYGVVLDSANNRALVIADGLGALVAVDLVNGQRVFVSR